MATSKTPGSAPASATPQSLAQPRVLDGAVGEPPLEVTLIRTAIAPTQDQALWMAIRNRSEAISFERYAAFIERLLCQNTSDDSAACGGTQGEASDFGQPSIAARRAGLAARPSIYGVDAYQLLKLATHAFLLVEGGVIVQPPRDPADGTISTDPVQPGQVPPANSIFATIPGEASRLGTDITYEEAQERLSTYLQTQIGGISAPGLPYLKRVATALLGDRLAQGLPFCDQVLRNRLTCPSMTELLWNYWWEEGHLVQGMNAIALRFQNRRRGPSDPLAPLALDPLRGMHNLLWGRLQDAPNQLSVSRRAHEYAYAYGLPLRGRAVDDLAPVENRSQFITAFHTLLARAAQFYRESSNTTVIPDGFALLQSLKEVHMVLALSANNQFEDLKRQARVEMMIDQWLLSRTEMREFLRGRTMVPFEERWMSQQDTLMRLHGWGDGTVSHYHYLATAGEMLLLSIRWGDWTGTIDQASASNWANQWRPEVQAYLHAYQAVTGVDLGAPLLDTHRDTARFAPPADLLAARQLPSAQRSPASLAGRGFVTAELIDELDMPVMPLPARVRAIRGV